jgi:hypothetical protein
MVELPPDEAQALSALLNGLGWGPIDRTKELVRARKRIDQALKVEGLPSCEPKKAA